MKRFITTIGLLFLIILISQSAFAFNKSIVKGGFGIKFGFINASTVHVTDKLTDQKVGDYLTNAGLSFALFLDIPQSRKLITSFEIAIQDIQAFDNREKVINVNFTFKRIIYKSRTRMAIKPYLGIGYAYLANLKMLQKVNFLTYHLGTEVVFLVDPKYALVTELGILGSPHGRNDDYKVTTNPILLLRAGIIF